MDEEFREIGIAGGGFLRCTEQDVAHGLDGGGDFYFQHDFTDVERLHEGDGGRDGPEDAVSQHLAQLLGVDARKIVHEGLAPAAQYHDD